MVGNRHLVDDSDAGPGNRCIAPEEVNAPPHSRGVRERGKSRTSGPIDDHHGSDLDEVRSPRMGPGPTAAKAVGRVTSQAVRWL